MRKSYKYLVEVQSSRSIYPRHLADWISHDLDYLKINYVKDLQRKDHIYGDTYKVETE